MQPLKQALVVRDDLGMSRGKMIAQACHASLGAYLKAPEEEQAKWKNGGSKKVVLDSGDMELRDIYSQADQQGIPAFLVKDAGMTELEPGTETAVGIGPAKEDKIDVITGDMRLIK